MTSATIDKGKVFSDGLPMPQRGWAMAAILIGTGLASLEGSIANVALPTIAKSLQVSPAAAVWVVNAYQLTVAALLLSCSALGERIGYRKVYLAGWAIFTASSLLCALAQDLQTLVLARALQGLGGAGVMSVSGALLRYTYPQSMLGRAIGLNALFVSIALVLGPTVASAILSIADWQWLFAINVPIGLVVLLLAYWTLPYSDQSTEKMDVASVALSAVLFGGAFIGSDMFTKGPGNALPAALVVCLAIAAGIILVRREMSVRLPLIPVDLLAIPAFGLSAVISACFYSAYMLAFLALPFYFVTVLHLDQTQAGWMMTPWPLAMAIVGPMIGRLSDHVRPGLLSGTGLAVMAVGLVLLATMGSQATLFDIAWRMAACGCGFALFQAPNNRIMLSSAPRSRAGSAAGMLATARLTGMTIGATLAAAVFRLAGENDEMIALLLGAAFAAIGVGISLLRKN